MTPLERAARAINAIKGQEGFSYEEFCLSAARAVLAALREPSDAMIKAGCSNQKLDISADGMCHCGGLYPDSAMIVFTAMIDTALNET